MNIDLANMVPSFELCKKIPQGAFADSNFYWCERVPEQISPYGKIIQNETERIIHIFDVEMIGEIPEPDTQEKRIKWLEKHRGNPDEWCCITKAVYPAPTVARIMANSQPCILYRYDDTFVACDTSNVHSFKDYNPANAALKLWLELKKGN